MGRRELQIGMAWDRIRGSVRWHGRGIIVIGQWNLELWAGIIMSNNYSQIDKLENL